MAKLFSRLRKREKFLFGVTACVILSLGFYILVVEPLYKRWSDLDSDFEAAKSRLFKNLKLLSQKESLERQYEKYKVYMEKTQAAEDETAAILKEIENVALSCGVKITGIKPKAARQFKTYRKFRIEVVAEAKIGQFMKFIYDLESSKRLLKVERLVLSLKGTQSELLKATLIIRKISF